MSTTQAISTINEALHASANARMVYGEPVQLQKKIVLPVAKMVFGYGAGGVEVAPEPAEHSGQGGGGGVGMIAYPAGVFEITEKKTRFIAASRKTTWGISLAIAFILGTLAGMQKAKRGTP